MIAGCHRGERDMDGGLLVVNSIENDERENMQTSPCHWGVCSATNNASGPAGGDSRARRAVIPAGGSNRFSICGGCCLQMTSLRGR